MEMELPMSRGQNGKEQTKDICEKMETRIQHMIKNELTKIPRTEKEIIIKRNGREIQENDGSLAK